MRRLPAEGLRERRQLPGSWLALQLLAGMGQRRPPTGLHWLLTAALAAVVVVLVSLFLFSYKEFKGCER